MICKDCIHNAVCKYGEARSNGLYCTGEKCKQYQSTADVAPKSEVEKLERTVKYLEGVCESLPDKVKAEVSREIFKEIEREIVAALRSNYSAKQERVEKQIPDDFVSYMCEGKIAALRGIDDFIAELKKKYTEDKK